MMTTKEWLLERKNNCLRIGALRTGADREGWIEDAKFFQAAMDGLEGRAAHAMVAEFHVKFEVPILATPEVPPEARRQLRVNLINEEAREFEEASAVGDLVGAADALADLAYVIYGAALEWGIPLDAVLSEVHRSNLTIVWQDGTIHRREGDGKILKPPTYSPADVSRILAEAACRL